HPYTKALLKAVFSVDEEKNQQIEILTGEVPSPLDLPVGCPFQNRCRYCRDICKEIKPQLEEIEENHFVACHLQE
ncbi:MAG: peptide ABC transporter ATP-binding protein, partial [Firmicutes bacterium]|nr:peptide ABC transporter ATP-binding protein [Candidatus Alectryobacillus merdavium]